MPETNYEYNVSQTQNNAVDPPSLRAEIEAPDSLIPVQLSQDPRVTVFNNIPKLNLYFKDALDLSGKAALDAIVSAHDGEPSFTIDRVEVSNQPNTREDGTLYATPKPASFGFEMCDRDFRVICSKVDSKAMHTVVNGANGSVTYASARAGSQGNNLTITVQVGDTGLSALSRPLSVARAGADVVVTFGTDENGDSVVPTALEVANLINNDLSIALYHMNAVPSGDGSGEVAATAQASLSGGTNPSCEDLYVRLSTLEEVSWGELYQLGVWKDGGGSMVPCADQADADANAICTAWEYVALDPQTQSPLKYELRDGFLVVDPSFPANEMWDHRCYSVAAPLIAGSLGGSIRVFDGYLGPAPDGVVAALSPQTVVMDPELGPGASSIRVYVFYPAGSALNHLIRLVTYRAPGTFPD